MSSIVIYADNTFSIDGRITGYRIEQTLDRTVIKKDQYKHIAQAKDFGEEITLPQQRYALSSENPSTGVAGRSQLEKDLLEIWNSK